jgi:peroxiredoxin
MVETKRMIARARALSASGWLRMAIIAVALIAILVVVGIRVSMPSDASTPALAGKPAPDFTLPIVSAPGAIPQTVSLAGQHGHPVILVFFFTLCTHCQPQLRAVHAAAAPYAARGLETYAINSPAESYDVLSNYVMRLGFDPLILRDTRATVASAYGAQVYPTTFLIDGQGAVRGVWTGETSTATLDRALRQVAAP